MLTLLAIEFLDELLYSAREAAWPLIRTDLHLDYFQIGILLSLPAIMGNLLEIGVGVLGDTPWRRRLILGGGVIFTLSTLLMGVSGGYAALLVAFLVNFPASGAFVTLSQASLMDHEPDRHEQNMSRWTFAGSLAVVAGPLALSGAVYLGWGWRGAIISVGILAMVLLGIAWRSPGFTALSQNHRDSKTLLAHFSEGFGDTLRALKRKEVLRWFVLLEFSDLMLDVFYGYLALYLVDVVGAPPVTAGLAVGIWTGVGLLGDFLLIPLLERIKGLTYLRYSAFIELVLFPTFLLSPWLVAKLIILGLLGFFNAGWYSILSGNLYSSMPGQSGKVMAASDIFGIFGKLIPFGIGLAAQYFGLGYAIWLLILGPVALFVGIPRRGLPEKTH